MCTQHRLHVYTNIPLLLKEADLCLSSLLLGTVTEISSNSGADLVGGDRPPVRGVEVSRGIAAARGIAEAMGVEVVRGVEVTRGLAVIRDIDIVRGVEIGDVGVVRVVMGVEVVASCDEEGCG